MVRKKIFGFERSTDPEVEERQVKKTVERALKQGVNGSSVFFAFQAARIMKEAEGLSLTNNHLLNIIKETAIAMSGTEENFLYGSREATLEHIDNEITSLRNSLTDEEKRK